MIFKNYKSCLILQQVSNNNQKALETIKTKMQLMNPFYIVLFYLLVIQCGVFIILSILPKQLQRKFVEKFTQSTKMDVFWKIHFVFCLILVIFFFDLHTTQINFENQKKDLKTMSGFLATELRKGYLSYSTLKVQRNKYIVFTLFFTSIVTTVYIRLLNFYYKTEDSFKCRETIEKVQVQEKNQNGITQDTDPNKQD